MTPQFFGDSAAPLFGVHHPARRTHGASKAVVLCPPLGHEYLRTHWMMRLLAAQLARDGVHVLRFDYYGTGDSGGFSYEVRSLDVWVDNVNQAMEQLRDESAAEHVALLGLRLGAVLAARAAASNASVPQVLLWDPVISGQSYLAGLRGMHQQMLDLWVCPMSTENSGSIEEVLGFRYARSLIREIESIHLGQDLPTGRRCLFFADQGKVPFAQADITRNEEPEDWDDLRTIETAMLRPKTLRGIVRRLLDSSLSWRKQPDPTGTVPIMDLPESLPDIRVTP